MTRFLKIWLLLFVVNLFSRIMAGYLVFGYLDFRDSHFFQLIVVPPFQAVILVWITEATSFQHLFEVLKRALARQRILSAFLAVDLMILVAGLVADTSSRLSISGEKNLALYYSSVKVLVAGCWIVYRIDRWSRFIIERLWFGLFGLGLCLYGLFAVTGWGRLLPEMALPEYGLLVRWVVVNGLLYGCIIVILLKTSHSWRLRSESATLFLNAAIAFVLLTPMPAVINSYDFLQWKQPWLSLYRSFEFLATAFVWLGVLDLRVSANSPPSNVAPGLASRSE